MKDRVLIRYAHIRDVKNLAVLKQQVWISTYAIEGIRHEFSNYVLSEFTLDNVGKTIQNKNILLLIAEIDNHMIGCVEINFNNKCPLRGQQHYPEIKLLYVLERFTGIGIGKELLTNALTEIKKRNFKATWLTVYHENKRAIKFYKKMNFKMIGDTEFEMEGNRYKNNVMSIEIL